MARNTASKITFDLFEAKKNLVKACVGDFITSSKEANLVSLSLSQQALLLSNFIQQEKKLCPKYRVESSVTHQLVFHSPFSRINTLDLLVKQPLHALYPLKDAQTGYQTYLLKADRPVWEESISQAEFSTNRLKASRDFNSAGRMSLATFSASRWGSAAIGFTYYNQPQIGVLTTLAYQFLNMGWEKGSD